ncbi:MAG: gamma carbonic anhydrase family protein [Candidatus Bathyarchaeota archaeon]
MVAIGDRKPQVEGSVFLAPGSFIIGDVTIKEGSGVWYGAVIRGDDDYIEIGSYSTILENCIVEAPFGNSVRIGNNAIISHGAIVHGATVGDKALVGIGAIVLDKAEIGKGAIVGAGAIVPPGAVVPPNTIALGVPAKVVREIREEEKEMVALERERVTSKADKYKKIYLE